MITWMQRHKKWLVITIWVSAISFIGAGMVDWGSYGFGASNDRVARVGKLDIHIAEFQRDYARLSNAYASQLKLQGGLDEAMAKQLGVPQEVLQRLIERTRLLNFAYDLGLSVSDEEVARAIIDEKYFVDSQGNFSDDVYARELQSMGYANKSEFEEAVRKQLIIQKLFAMMNAAQPAPMLPVSAGELASLEMANAVRDRVEVKILPLNQVTITIKDDELKEFWEKNAGRWKTPAEFEIEYILTPFNAQNPTDKELAEYYENNKSEYLNEAGEPLSLEQSRDEVLKDVQKREAESVSKREYRDLKNGSKKGKILTLKDNERFFVKNGIDLVIEDIKAAQVGQVLKPIEADDGFVTLKILAKKDSVNKGFEEAKDEARTVFEQSKKQEKLTELAEMEVKKFKGTDIGFIDRFYNGAILTLDTNQKARFLSQIFSSRQKEGYVMLGDKAVLYRILGQEVTTHGQGDAMMIKGAKSEAVFLALSEYLDKTYKTTIYIDVSK